MRFVNGETCNLVLFNSALNLRLGLKVTLAWNSRCYCIFLTLPTLGRYKNSSQCEKKKST